MLKWKQRWKISLTLACVLIAAGTVMMTVGIREIFQDNQRVAEKQQFETLALRFRQTFEAESKEDPLSIADEFGELARRSAEYPSVASRAFYNQGWLYLRSFAVRSEKNHYLLARTALRDSLRKDPQFFDAKYNLVYLEVLARSLGIADLTTPFQFKNDLASENERLGTPTNDKEGADSRKEKDDSGRSLKNKIMGGGNEQGLGGEPLNPDDMDPEDLSPPPPPKEY